MNHNHNSMPSQFRGVYGRVARKIGVDASYVSRVARGERQSKRIADALQQAIGIWRMQLRPVGNGMRSGTLRQLCEEHASTEEE